jgi:hypothetical protein
VDVKSTNPGSSNCRQPTEESIVMKRKNKSSPNPSRSKRQKSSSDIDSIDTLAAHRDDQRIGDAFLNGQTTRYRSVAFSDTVDIVAGSGVTESEPMRIPMWAARQVPFFDNCLKDGFAEAQNRTIKLPEDDPEVVDAFLRLLVYGLGRQTIDLDGLVLPESVDGQSDADSMRTWENHLVKVYVLADKLSAEKQSNRLIDLLRILWQFNGPEEVSSREPSSQSYAPGLESITTLQNAGLDGSLMFELLLHQVVYFIQAQRPNGFTTNLMTELWSDSDKWLEAGGPAVRHLVRLLVENEELDDMSLQWDFDIEPRPTSQSTEERCRWHTHLLTNACT